MLPIPHVWPQRAIILAVILTASRAGGQEPSLPSPLLAENSAPATTVAGSDVPVSTPIPVDADPGVDAPLLPVPNAPAPQPILATPSQNVTLNLINRLVQKGILTQVEAADLIKGAEEDAAFARAQAQALAETQAAVAAQNVMPPVEPDSEEVRVTYIPESVKAQIRDQLRTEVFAQAREQKWAAPNAMPEWTQRIKMFGDIRTRYQSFMFPQGNNNTGVFPDFNAINTNVEPFDVSGPVFSPQLNVDQNRTRELLRLRLGFDIDLEDGFTTGIRIASGTNNAPVSTNQTLGAAGPGGQAGFAKYQLWLDRAFIKYEASFLEHANVVLLMGRFENPFMRASQILWDDDVNLDGIALKLSNQWSPGFKTFLLGGAFPVFNTAFNFPSHSPTKASSYDKYLLAAQFGVEFKITDEIEAKFGIGYYDWKNIEGRLSSPFVPLNLTDAGDTDDSRPLFAQHGNTYRPLRNIIPSALNGFGTTNQFQYFGLASEFRQLALSGKVSFNHWEPVQISLVGDYVKNMAFDREAINGFAINNRSGGGAGSFDGGDTAWYLGVNFGKDMNAFQNRGDWSFSVGYRHVESDAVVDAFTDSNFGFGATNAEGYTLNAAMALSKNTMLRASYMSATQIAGPTFQADTFFIDFSARF